MPAVSARVRAACSTRSRLSGIRPSGSAPIFLRALALLPFVRQNLRMIMARAQAADLQILADLVQAGSVTPVIDRTYAPSEVPDAIGRLHSGDARGKLVVTV